MIGNWDKSIQYLLETEGSELNVGPSEPGGASKYGVSLTVLSEWFKRVATVDDVAAVTPELASKIYRMKFADYIAFDTMPSGVDYRLLDIAANLGVAGGSTLLQAVVGDWQNHTIQQLVPMITDPKTVIRDLGMGWISIKSRAPNWFKYAHGWMNRNNLALERANAMLGA